MENDPSVKQILPRMHRSEQQRAQRAGAAATRPLIQVQGDSAKIMFFVCVFPPSLSRRGQFWQTANASRERTGERRKCILLEKSRPTFSISSRNSISLVPEKFTRQNHFRLCLRFFGGYTEADYRCRYFHLLRLCC